MKARMRVLFCVSMFVIATGFAAAQATDDAEHDINIDINHVAMIDLDDAAPMALTTNDPATAGLVFTGDTDNRRLFYTLLTASTTSITAELIDGGGIYDVTPPAGTLLYLEATSVTGTGTPGGSSGQITLDNTAQDIIDTIGTCYTGDAAPGGAVLLYTLAIDDPSLVVADDSAAMHVVFTLTSSL